MRARWPSSAEPAEFGAAGRPTLPPPAPRPPRRGPARHGSPAASARARASAASTRPGACTAWQAATCADPAAAPGTDSSARSSPRQRASIPSRSASPDATTGHRGWKRQPDGIRVGSGASPARICGSRCRASRHDREQRARVGMPRVVEQLLGRPLLDDPPEVHDRDAVGDVPGQPEVVRDDEDRDAGLADQPEHQLQDLAAHRGVEARDRLVGDEQLAARAPSRPRSRRAGAGRRRPRTGRAAKNRSGGRRPDRASAAATSCSSSRLDLWIRRPSATAS